MKKLFYKLTILIVIGSTCLLIANFIYENKFYKADVEKINGALIFDQDSLQYVSDVLYYAESSNSSTNPKDTCLLSISEMIDSLSWLKVSAVEHEARHARTFLLLLKNLKSASKVKTVIVTLNLRSFGSSWINSKLETNISQTNIMYEQIPPIFKRLKLAFNSFDNTPEQIRNIKREKDWQNLILPVSDSFPNKTVRQWDNSMANGTYLKPNGDWDMPKIDLACHFIKAYAFIIDTLNNARISDFDEIVKVTKQKNIKLILNLMAENIEYADSLVGKELTSIMLANKSLLVNRYNQQGVIVVDNFNLVKGINYTDQNWTTEHYNQIGRWDIAKNVSKYLK